MTPPASRKTTRPPAPGLAAPTPTTLRRTQRGWRLSQHGTVLSEILAQPGPTHSVFDVLAAACLVGPPVRDLALLGFGGGGVVAALRALGCTARIHAVDLDPTGWNLLRQSGAPWLEPIHWHRTDAVAWLQNPARFDVIVDDLSIPRDGDVIKPEATWNVLPARVASRLRPGGRALFNLLRPADQGWTQAIQRVTAEFGPSVVIHLEEFENRILVAEPSRPKPAAPSSTSPRLFGAGLRSGLRRLASRQSERVRVHCVPRAIP